MKDNQHEPSFEERVTQLETIVKTLEKGDASLEEALQLFEEGIALSRQLKKQLDRTEKRIEQVLQDEDGRLRPLTMEMDDET